MRLDKSIPRLKHVGFNISSVGAADVSAELVVIAGPVMEFRQFFVYQRFHLVIAEVFLKQSADVLVQRRQIVW